MKKALDYYHCALRSHNVQTKKAVNAEAMRTDLDAKVKRMEAMLAIPDEDDD